MIQKNIIYMVTGIGVMMILLTVILLFNSMYFQTIFVVSLLVTFTPLIILNYLDYRRVKMIEMYLADFLRDVAESTRSGMPFEKSLESAASGNYGPLTEEMQIVASQISWGVAFEDCLLKFSKRVNSKLVQQTVIIIVESYRSGGDIADILETVSADIRTLKEIETSRRSDLQIYVISTYFIFFMFLAIILVLAKSFVPATPQLSSVAQIIGGSQGSTITEAEYITFFFHLSLIEAFFAGLVSGQMGEGSITAGFKHSFILIVITLLSFQIFLAPEPIAVRIANEIVRLPPSTMSATSAELTYTIYGDTSADDIAARVKDATKDKPEWKDFSKDAISFTYSDCPPCEKGDIIVQSSLIMVKKTTAVKYSVSAAQGKYIVQIRGGS